MKGKKIKRLKDERCVERTLLIARRPVPEPVEGTVNLQPDELATQ